ncbi:glycoside hydrolase family 2 protein [Agromyces sp. NPDC127015]|uniref:glycoside hydrolase family 2 protein n=1 Tax=Agromyces sp. NPDC127015 TaxID=3347108 RepID=UPI00365AE5EF
MSRRTPWADAIDPAAVLPEYPRPQLARDSHLSLNGWWEHAFTVDDRRPPAWAGAILVPFSPEAELSGVGRQLQPGEHLWYRRTVRLPEGFLVDRVVLHFGAVDQRCRVFVDDVLVGAHAGGYLPFSLDVTDALADGEEHELVVDVVDPSDTSYHSRGKQSLKRGGIWYTAQSGIWQSVWIESVPALHVAGLDLRPRLDDETVEVVVEASTPHEPPTGGATETATGPAGPPVATVVLLADGLEVARAEGAAGATLTLAVPQARRWSPDDPYLYDVEVRLGDDLVRSYVGMRSVGVAPDAFGRPRLVLNGEPVFHAAVLDQGYWPEGLYTPPSDEAMVHDLTSMKALGFNAVRKHIKIEPLRWYHHCDRLGLLVWQDMVNGGRRYNPAVITAPVKLPVRLDDRRHRRFGRQDASGRAEFTVELESTVRLLKNAPSVVVWVPFNEGWGQFDALDAVERVREIDPSRVVDHASGWHDQGGGDLLSLHVYFRRLKPGRDWGRDGRAVVVSEYGGYSLRLPGHEFSPREFGYRRYRSVDALTDGFVELHRREVLPAIAAGLSGIVYTQLSDVEDELNGLLTADRTVVKVDADRVRDVLGELFAEFAAATTPELAEPARRASAPREPQVRPAPHEAEPA